MKNVPNQNGKVLEETLAGSNSSVVKTTIIGLQYFKMTLLLLQILEKHLPFSLSICHILRIAQ